MLFAGKLLYGPAYPLDVIDINIKMLAPYESYYDFTPNVYGKLIAYKMVGTCYDNCTLKIEDEYTGEFFTKNISENIYSVNTTINKNVFGYLNLSLKNKYLNFEPSVRFSYDGNENYTVLYDNQGDNYIVKIDAGKIKNSLQTFNISTISYGHTQSFVDEDCSLEVGENINKCNWTYSFWFKSFEPNTYILNVETGMNEPYNYFFILSTQNGLRILLNTSEDYRDENISANLSQWNHVVLDMYNQTLSIYLNKNKVFEEEIDDNLFFVSNDGGRLNHNFKNSKLLNIDEGIWFLNKIRTNQTFNITKTINQLYDAGEDKQISIKLIISRLFN